MAKTAYLILDDRSVWKGIPFGADPPPAGDIESAPVVAAGEVIFNTGMTGYHEILTDPSYTGQIVMMTYPHIGNYGCDDAWSEVGPEKGRSPREVKVRGLVVRDHHFGPVPRGRLTLDAFLRRHGICGISDIDTRALTLKIRDEGSRNGVIIAAAPGKGLDEREIREAERFLKSLPPMTGRALVSEVGTREPETVNPEGNPRVALLDCGVKAAIIRELASRGCRVDILPADATARTIREVKPDSLLVSNGPGDPEPLERIITVIRELLGEVPVWGICLGHQLISLASGGETYKMTFGHHGVNHPVRDERTGRVFVTSQNHGFAVDEKSLPSDVEVRFRNANDGSVEGIASRQRRFMAVQHHPEAAPGPMDSAWVFDAFLETLTES